MWWLLVVVTTKSAQVIRIKLQKAAAPSFLSAKRRGDEVTGLVADLAGSGQGAEQALTRLHELLATPSTAAAVRSSNVMGGPRGLAGSYELVPEIQVLPRRQGTLRNVASRGS